MSQTGGLEPTSGTSQPGGLPEQLSGQEGANVMQTPIHTLGELKKVLVEHFGEKDGKKAYNNFLFSFGMLMLSQVQHSADQAKKASQRMRQDVS